MIVRIGIERRIQANQIDAAVGEVSHNLKAIPIIERVGFEADVHFILPFSSSFLYLTFKTVLSLYFYLRQLLLIREYLIQLSEEHTQLCNPEGELVLVLARVLLCDYGEL